MTLTFPDPSRRFDVARNAVDFKGYDGLFEIRFLVEAGAIAKPGTPRTLCLTAFDESRDTIQEAARRAYARGRRGFYVLTAASLR
ncbi:MAG: DUF1488 family protein [Rhodospirillales bacterium]|nr:DUF1488 family protein [Rhodospirillales bacterium]